MGDVHNEIRRFGALLSAFQNATGLEQDAGIERLSETLTPIFDIWRLPEHAYLRGEVLCWGFASATAVAGQNGHVQLLNPAGSPVLAVIELVEISAEVGGLYSILAYDGTVFAEGGAKRTRDRRWPDARTPISQLRVGTNVGVVGGSTSFHRYVVGGAEIIPWDPRGYILGPGCGILVEADQVNTRLNVNWLWRERRPLRSEI